MTDSRRLLAEYVASGSEKAFRELVERYINLVYSTARRLIGGDVHLAQDVTQIVFADFAQKAHGLSSEVMLGGWLHQRTFHVATTLVRGERRRQDRERRACEMNSLEDSPANTFTQVAPALDEAILQLNSDDRKAILLRFFEQQDFRSVGDALGSNEDAARMRVNRALEKLHSLLTYRGVTLSAAALGTALTSEAVTAAPAGLAASISSAALATAAAGTGTTFTLLKVIAMTKVQFGVTALVLAGAAISLMVQHHSQTELREQNQLLQQQIAQLQNDNETLSNRFTQTGGAMKLRLPAPRVPAPTSASEADSQSTNLIARLNRGEKAPLLTTEQAEKYLSENRRNAASLLAAFRATGDQKLLREATKKYPNDPQVAFTAAYAPDVSPEDRRRWLDAFKQSAPENSLANYLSSLDHFKAGRADQAIEDLSAAASKQKFQDYSWDFIQGGQEAYRSAGYSEAEARIIPSMALVLPQLAELKQLNEQMINLATGYRQAGDEASAQAALQMDAALGQRLNGPGNIALITQLVGMSIESVALRQMDSSAPYGNSGQTVKDRLDEVNQRRITLTDFAKQLDGIYETISAGGLDQLSRPLAGVRRRQRGQVAAQQIRAEIIPESPGRGYKSDRLAIAMSGVQFRVAAFVIAAAVIGLFVQHQRQLGLREQSDWLREQVARLQKENKTLAERIARKINALAPRLPAPPIQATVSTNAPVENLSSATLLARAMENPLRLTVDQAEKFLDDNCRSAASLLAAYRTTTNAAYLDEAMRKFPDNPQVAFEGVLRNARSTEEKRRWLEALKKSAPDNSLANYLSALEYFNSGQSDLAVQELVAASSKSQLNNYFLDRVQANAEALRAAGSSEAETSLGAVMGLPNTQELYDFRDLQTKMLELANLYRQAGDTTSAQTVLQMLVGMAQHFDGSQGASGVPASTRIVALDIESHALAPSPSCCCSPFTVRQKRKIPSLMPRPMT